MVCPPTSQPSGQPTCMPTVQPSDQPTGQPTGQPTSQPTSQPTTPTGQPTGQPTSQPTPHAKNFKNYVEDESRNLNNVIGNGLKGFRSILCKGIGQTRKALQPLEML